MIARDVWGCHPDELSPEQHDHLIDFLALNLIEQEEMKEYQRRHGR